LKQEAIFGRFVGRGRFATLHGAWSIGHGEKSLRCLVPAWPELACSDLVGESTGSSLRIIHALRLALCGNRWELKNKKGRAGNGPAFDLTNLSQALIPGDKQQPDSVLNPNSTKSRSA